MKMFKRILALSLALTLVAGLGMASAVDESMWRDDEEAPPVCPFEDVTDKDMSGAVARLFKAGIVKGTSDTTYEPEEGLTRAEFMTMLGRAAFAEVNHSAPSAFTDVINDGWSTGYITWGVENGLLEGNGDGTFGQYDKLTKEHVNLIMERYNKAFETEFAGYRDAEGDATRGDVAIVLSNAFAPAPSKVKVKYLDKSEFKAWGEYLDDEDYISFGQKSNPAVDLSKYEERTFKIEDTEEKSLVGMLGGRTGEPYKHTIGDMTYFVYDPIANGADPNGTYPVMVWFHGSGNAANNRRGAIGGTGSGIFTTPEFQEKLGGAYIICPAANEYNEGWETRMNWPTALEGSTESIYLPYLKQLIDGFIDENKDNYNGKLVIAGTSAGGYMAWNYTVANIDDITATLLMAPAYVPTDEDIAKVAASDIKMWCINALHDELVTYDQFVGPVRDKLLALDNFELTEMEWMRNSDGGIATLSFGMEMGQHCMFIQVGNNLMYDDGTPMDETHPEGVLAWFIEVLK